jgi:hypothetical protein
MDYPKYAIKVGISYGYFEFISIGIKGIIPKAIFFAQDEDIPNIYHCIMGDINEDSSIDTETITNNGDMEKVLSTVADATILFLSQYPDCKVNIKGSNKARTRLCRMAMNANYENLIRNFEIFGVIDAIGLMEPFEKGIVKDYDSFLVNKKR